MFLANYDYSKIRRFSNPPLFFQKISRAKRAMMGRQNG
jgi:hypothetical protein